MKKTAYHLLAPEAVPLRFWQTGGEDQETVTRLEELEDSMRSYNTCWIVWDTQQQAFYEQRDLYRCSIVAAHEYDVLDRAIPYGDLRNRASLPIFFSAQEFQQILATDPHKLEPVCKKARAFLTSIRGDEQGNKPVISIEVAVPVASFCAIADRARSGAARHGKHIVMLHTYLLYLKAALFSLYQQIQQETDPARRQALVHQRKRLQQMRDIRSAWKHHHKQYITVEQHSQDTYIVHVGLHSSLVQEAA